MPGSLNPAHHPAATGLTEAEARARLRRDGPNRLPQRQRKNVWSALLPVLRQPMVLLLLGCTALYALLGEAFDASALAVSVVVVAFISVYQELRTERVLEALRDLASPRSTVIRDGSVRRIGSEELVVGDSLVVQEGDRLACDARLIDAHGLRVDESLLTGESAAVDKLANSADEENSTLRAGTLVVQGDGVAEVVATGVRTALGSIGRSLTGIEARPSRLQGELKRLVRDVAVAALVTCVIAATTFALRDGSWTSGLLVGLTLAMSIVPEEFAVVWTVMLALGAWRLARAHVLTRQPQAIEALGTATVLCTDKTGTLTWNRMEVVALHDGLACWERGGETAPTALGQLLRVAARASVRQGIEPMDRAIFVLLDEPDAQAELVARENPATGRPFVIQVWHEAGHDEALVAIKGAPEAVFARCANVAPALRAACDRWSTQGLRVLAVATAKTSVGAALPEAGWTAVGAVGFLDPLRDDVPAAVADCRRAGVRVVMITGDSPATGLAIAKAAGIASGIGEQQVLTGSDLEKLNEASLEAVIPAVTVFARVTPAQKLRIVQALQRRGEVVAMTGDGVNDGPALRAADIGVAMGQRGTDLAREAAALVLLDDRFPALVEAVKAGRRIFSNLQKALAYLFAVHVPIVGVALLPLLGGPVLLMPLHVVLLELIIDPACSLVFESEPATADCMAQPPRRADAPLFGRKAITRALGIGFVALALVAAVQWVGQVNRLEDDALRLTAFASIVVTNLAMVRWFRAAHDGARHPNSVFHALLLGACLTGTVVLALAPARRALGFPPHLDAAWLLALIAVPAGWSLLQLMRRGSAAVPGPTGTDAAPRAE